MPKAMGGALTEVESRPTITFPYLVGAAGIGFAICYAAVFTSLVTLWATYPLYSHGYAVPLIAASICWMKYRDRPSIARVPDYVLGIPLILIGVGLLVIGQVGAMVTIGQTSLIVALAGFILVFFGRKTLASYRFPFAYLLFMIPIWDVGLNQLQDPSRLISARIASGFLHLTNVPVIRQDTTLVLPTVTLSVLRQCSGVNQLVAMMAMVVPASYVFLNTNTRRLALIAFSVVVGYVSNGFRIALVGWFAVHGLGDGDLAGSYRHLLEGLIVSAAGYTIIIFVLSWLVSFNGTRGETLPYERRASQSSLSFPLKRRPLIDLGIIGVLFVAGIVPLVAGAKDVGLPRALGMLPGTLGNWRAAEFEAAPFTRVSGVSEDLVGAYPTSAGVRRFAGVDDEISRVYENSDPIKLRLYVGYYRRQAEGRELAGDAGQVLATASTPVSLTIGSEEITAREIVRAADGLERGVLYWYDIDGRIVSNPYLTKAYTVWNGLIRQRTNGAVIMITWESAPAAHADGRAAAFAFAHELVPVLRSYFDRSEGRLVDNMSDTRNTSRPSDDLYYALTPRRPRSTS